MFKLLMWIKPKQGNRNYLYILHVFSNLKKRIRNPVFCILYFVGYTIGELLIKTLMFAGMSIKKKNPIPPFKNETSSQLIVISSFGSHADEPVESWIVCRVSSLLSPSTVHRHLWTVLLPTGLIIETSYQAFMPPVHAHELLSQYDLYF